MKWFELRSVECKICCGFFFLNYKSQSIKNGKRNFKWLLNKKCCLPLFINPVLSHGTLWVPFGFGAHRLQCCQRCFVFCFSVMKNVIAFTEKKKYLSKQPITEWKDQSFCFGKCYYILHFIAGVSTGEQFQWILNG